MGEPVGFVGLGIMGSRMAANLARAGYEVAVHNRTAEKAEAWVAEHGGRLAATPRDAAEGAAAVITMVVDGPQVEHVLLGEDGAAHGAAPGTLTIDMSTIAPADARRIGAALAERRLPFVDAPVSGSAPKAEEGTLTIMAGGGEADVERARPYFEAMGELILHVGELGQGQTVKVISNAVGATNCATLAQALVAGKAAGVDLPSLVSVLGASSAASYMVTLKAERDARARLHAAVPARAHAQGRGRSACPRPRRPAPRSRRPRWRASFTSRRWAAGSPSRTSRRSSRRPRGWPGSGSDASSPGLYGSKTPALQADYGIAEVCA